MMGYRLMFFARASLRCVPASQNRAFWEQLRASLRRKEGFFSAVVAARLRSPRLAALISRLLKSCPDTCLVELKRVRQARRGFYSSGKRKGLRTSSENSSASMGVRRGAGPPVSLSENTALPSLISKVASRGETGSDMVHANLDGPVLKFQCQIFDPTHVRDYKLEIA